MVGVIFASAISPVTSSPCLLVLCSAVHNKGDNILASTCVDFIGSLKGNKHGSH